MKVPLRKLLIISLLLTTMISFNRVMANEPAPIADTAQENKSFDVKTYIFDHILDAHEWHICVINKHHISIPLPVIVYSELTGWHVFMSTKFHHGHEAFEGLSISKITGKEGKILETDYSGNITFPLDLSITKNVLTLLMSLILLVFLFLKIGLRYKNHTLEAPKGIQSLLEPIILFVRDDIAKPSIGDKYEKFLPYLLTIFFFIWFNNMLGLIPIFPGGANLTGNIAVTMVMAVFTFVIMSFVATKHYWIEIVNPEVPIWLKFPIPLMPLIEIVGLITKPFTLMVRLFANITAGHIIGLAFIGLIFIFGQINMYIGYGVSIFSMAFMIFATLLELLVALIQAYVFTLLSAIYFGLAMVHPHHEEKKHS